MNDMFTPMQPDSDDDFIDSIAPDVMACLRKARFFDKLDDLLCPVADAEAAKECLGDYQLSKSVLEELGFNAADQEDIIDVLHAQGACCDCEVLYNVVETSRLKAKYWRKQAHR